MFPQELVMNSLRVRASEILFCALICFSETDLEKELEKLSCVSAKLLAMEWVSLFSSDVCEPVSARAQEPF